jgi:hypothetical protein
MVRRLGAAFFVTLAALTTFFIVVYFADFWLWPFTYMVIALVLCLVLISYVYFIRLRAAEGFFDKADDPIVILKFSTEGVRTESALGSTDLKWTVFDEILKFDDLWLLVYCKSGYMTLPLDQLTPECCQLIERQISTRQKT